MNVHIRFHANGPLFRCFVREGETYNDIVIRLNKFHNPETPLTVLYDRDGKQIDLALKVDCVEAPSPEVS